MSGAAVLTRETGVLTAEQVSFYREHGYLHIPKVFTPEETDELAAELDRLIREWALVSPGWIGPWRKVYMDTDTEKKSKLTSMHDLQFYSATWARAVMNRRLVGALSDLLGPNVELHHSTMHVKPPETGHPFPMHQDWAFYKHQNDRYVDVLVHLDDTRHENGEIRFLDGSHKNGPLQHIVRTPEGPCHPHLPTDKYKLEDTVAVPAIRGDVVCFNICTIHGSHLNVTDRPRRLVRVGYRDPENVQIAGQSLGRPGLMVHGVRPRANGQELFSINGPAEGELVFD
jgi:ectoine hydroxylase-related dioxygenase (phytanoyl-CoA dioxygenase family)